MAELTRIMEYIRTKAEKEADEIIEAAKRQCESELENAEIAAQAEYNKIINEEQENAVKIKNMAVSNAEQISAKNILKLKNDSINEIIKSIHNTISEADDAEYCALIKKLLEKYTGNKKENMVILFNSSDKAKLSSEIIKMLENENITISDENAEISGGFILRCGKIEENCSVDALIRDRYEELTDFISKNLFVQ